MKYIIYIPAFNVEATLESVVQRIPAEARSAAQEILIIDNASSDRTQEISLRLKETYKNVTVIRNETNKNYGGSQKIAYAHAIKRESDFVIMLHGDAQYAPESIPAILKHLSTGNFAMVFGSRMTGAPLAGGMPIIRFVMNKVLTNIQNTLMSANLSEFHSGYRGFSVRALKGLNLSDCSDDHDFDTDIIVKLLEKNLSIGEITIPTCYDKDSKSISFWRGVVYSKNVLLAAADYRLKKITARK